MSIPFFPHEILPFEGADQYADFVPGMTPEEWHDFQVEDRLRSYPSARAPFLAECLREYQDYWPTFYEKRKLKILFVDWFRKGADRVKLKSYRVNNDPEPISWNVFFDAINGFYLWNPDKDCGEWASPAWKYNQEDWRKFLEECEREAIPEMYAERKAKEKAESDSREWAKQEREYEKRQAIAAEQAATAQKKRLKEARAERRRVKKLRTSTVKRIKTACGCGHSRAYEIFEVGTERIEQQVALAAAFADTPDRCKPEHWALKSGRQGRSFKAFILLQVAEFDDGIGPDCAKLRAAYYSTRMVGGVRNPGELVPLLMVAGVDHSKSHAIWAAYMEWKHPTNSSGVVQNSGLEQPRKNLTF